MDTKITEINKLLESESIDGINVEVLKKEIKELIQELKEEEEEVEYLWNRMSC